MSGLINIDDIAFYNKVLQFTHKKYYPYYEEERRQLEGAAPLIQFTLHKQTIEIEKHNLECILSIAKRGGATHVLVYSNELQFFCMQGLITPVFTHVSNNFAPSSKSKVYPQQFNSNSKLIGMWCDEHGFVRINSDIKGMYILQPDGSYAHIKRAAAICQEIYAQNKFVRAGINPVFAEETINASDIQQAEDLVDYIASKNYSSGYIRKFAKTIKYSTRKIRWASYKQFKKKINNIIKETH